MRICSFSLSGYFRLLKKYIRHDLRILVYVILIITTFFCIVINIFSNEINKNLMIYGGVHESKTTYTFELGNQATPKELKLLFELLEEYNVKKIKKIWINAYPLLRVNIASDMGMSDFDLEGRGFTKYELDMGSNAIVLCNEDYQSYYKSYPIGSEISVGGEQFKLVGVSYTADQSVIPFNCLLNVKGSFGIDYLLLETEHFINGRDAKNITRKYYQQTGQDTLKIKSCFWDMLVDIFNAMYNYVFSIVLFLCLSILLLMQTGCILYYKNLTHKNVYIFSGGSEQYLRYIIHGEILVVIVISFILGYMIFLGERLWEK